ncbi:MAG: hypothetical protein ACKOPS_11035, partial [Cyanobium sp.]
MRSIQNAPAAPAVPTRPLAALLLGFAAAASVLAGCSKPKPAAVVPPQVQLVNPRPLITTDSADYQSTLEAIREIRLASEIAGRITAMP